MKYLGKVNRECGGDKGIVGHGALGSRTTVCEVLTVKKFLEGSTLQSCLKPECKRRGLPVSGLKAILVDRILKHINDNSTTPRFYINMDHSDANFGMRITDLNPQGFAEAFLVTTEPVPSDAAPLRALGDGPLLATDAAPLR